MARSVFYDLNVHYTPESKSNIGKIATLAKHFGYKGIAIRDNPGSCVSEKAGVVCGLEVFSALELKVEKASRLHGLAGNYRKKVDVIIVRGGSESINRAAVENSNVDILSGFGSMKDNGMNHILARSAHDNDVAVSFDLGEIICQRGGRRVRALSNFRKDLKLVRKYDVPFVLTSNAASFYDLRPPRELMALAELFGMTRDEAMAGISSNPERILTKNRPSENHVFDGVEVVNTDAVTEADEGGDQ